MSSQVDPSSPRNRAERREQVFGRVSDVQAALDISRSAAYQIVMSNQIASVKIGKSRRVLLSSLDDYVARLIGEVA